MSEQKWTRRDAASLILGALSVAGADDFFAAWLRAAEPHQTGPHQTSPHETSPHQTSPPPEPDRFSSYRPQFFSAEEFGMLQTFTEILIPTDDTPGAREAHVAAFIDFVVHAAREFAPETQDDWRDTLAYLRRHRFGALPASEQIAFIERISRDPNPDRGGRAVFTRIKDAAVHAFYTSRIGLVDVLEYKGFAYLTAFPGCTHPEHRDA